MNNPWFRKMSLVLLLVGTCLAIGCGSSNPDGKYRASDGSVTLDLSGGKASMNFAQVHIDGTYKVDGNKLIISPVEGDTSQTMVFTINKDGSLDAPQGAPFPRLEKAN